MALLVNAYSTLRTPLWPDFLPQAAVQRRDHADPELAAHLHGFVGYVNQAGDGQMTQARYHLMRHVQRVRQHFSFEVDDADFARWRSGPSTPMRCVSWPMAACATRRGGC